VSERWVLSKHAKERCVEMGLTRHDVLETLLHPVCTFPGNKAATTGAPTTIYRDDRLDVVTIVGAKVVVTVMWPGDFQRPEQKDEPT
jgi:hypothetical protein